MIPATQTSMLTWVRAPAAWLTLDLLKLPATGYAPRQRRTEVRRAERQQFLGRVHAFAPPRGEGGGDRVGLDERDQRDDRRRGGQVDPERRVEGRQVEVR